MALGAPHLAGVTVLDLSSVGPASRASRILADYGAEVIKVSPTSAKGGVLIQPPFYSYGAGRGMKRLRVARESGHPFSGKTSTTGESRIPALGMTVLPPRMIPARDAKRFFCFLPMSP